MGFCYASVTGTCVLQRKQIAPRPAKIDESAYNATPYDNRGWCRFEGGVAKLVQAHFASAAAGGSPLPERLQRADEARPKIVEIDGGESRPVEVGGSPRRVLREASRAIDEARFTGKGDREKVKRMLAEVEWVIKVTFEQLLEVVSEGELEPDPAALGDGGARREWWWRRLWRWWRAGGGDGGALLEEGQGGGEAREGEGTELESR